MLQLDAVGLLGHLSQGVGGAVDMGVAPLFAGPKKGTQLFSDSG